MADAGDPTRFAGAVMLGDLDDFAMPTQACVNPLIVADVADAEAKLGAGNDGPGRPHAVISLDSDISSGMGYVCWNIRLCG